MKSYNNPKNTWREGGWVGGWGSSVAEGNKDN